MVFSQQALDAKTRLIPYHLLLYSMPDKKFTIILTANYSPWSAYSGGGQRSTHNLASTFAEMGHDVTVIFSKSPFEHVPIPENLPYKLKWAIIPAFKTTRSAALRFLVPFSVNSILKKILKEKSGSGNPIIVHSNGEEGSRVHRLRKSGPFTFGFISTSRYPHLPDDLKKYDTLKGFEKLNFLSTNLKYVQQYKALLTADFCSPPSFWSGEDIKLLPEIDPEKVQPVHNGVPREFLNYHWKETVKGPIVFFGRLDHDKGVDTLFEGLGQIDTALLPPVYIIGRGPKQEEYKKMANRAPFSDKVSFMDWKSHDELGKIMETASMVVLPSRVENFSLAVLGAMCAGVPTIGTDVGGTAEIIDNEITGFLIKADQPDEITRTVHKLLTDPIFAIELGKNGKHKIREQFTWNHSCNRFLELYGLALQKQRTSN